MRAKTEQSPNPLPASRRRFLSGLTTLGVAALAAVAGGRTATPRGPRELPLREADFYKPHDLAG